MQHQESYTHVRACISLYRGPVNGALFLVSWRVGVRVVDMQLGLIKYMRPDDIFSVVPDKHALLPIKQCIEHMFCTEFLRNHAAQSRLSDAVAEVQTYCSDTKDP
jgi:hypothetical protein